MNGLRLRGLFALPLPNTAAAALDPGGGGAGAGAGAGAGDGAGAGGQPPAGAGAQPAWYESDPDWSEASKDAEFGAWVKKANPKSGVAVLRQFRELEGKLGSSLQPWKDGEDPTQWAGWDKLNAPKEAAAYKDKLKRPTMPDGMVYDEAAEARFLESAAKARLLPHQAQAALDVYAIMQAESATALKTLEAKERGELDKLYGDWGVTKSAEGKWDTASNAQVQLAQRGARAMGVDGDLAAQIEGFAGGARMMTFFAKAGQLLGEGKLHEGDPGGGTSKEAALARIAALDEKFKKGGLTKDEKAERSRLFAIAYPAG